MSIISLAGMIGVGKSTYSKEIGNHFGYDVMYESVDNNRVLEKFYLDPVRWSFPLQIEFLNDRFRAIKKALRQGNVVLDRSIYEDELFTYINYKQGNMSKIEVEIYKDLLRNMMEELTVLDKKSPDLLIYLRSDFDTVIERIQKRSRSYEIEQDNLDYFKLLHSHYDDFIYNHYNASEVLTIQANELELSNEKDKKYVMDLLDKKLNNK